jgi:hypothetical protein
LLFFGANTLLNVPNPPGTSNVTIIPAPGGPVAVNATGVPMDVYTVTNSPAVIGPAGLQPASTLAAYICNYTPGGVHPVLLGSLGDYCFTTNLNGCTFGIGPVQPHNTRRVSHANSGGNTLLQRGQTMGVHGGNLAGVTLLEPALYRRIGQALNMQATVFGIRTGVNWRFYFQSFSSHGHGNLRVYGVFPIM